MPDADAEIARASMLQLAPDGFEEIERDGWIELVAYTDVAGEASFRETFREVSSMAVDAGWEDRWREFHRPVYVGGLWIGPPWEPVPPGETAVVVDPGRAFGTGAHPTTRACIELLAEIRRGSLLDAGCAQASLQSRPLVSDSTRSQLSIPIRSPSKLPVTPFAETRHG